MIVSAYTLFATGRSYLEALKMVRQSSHFADRENAMILPCGMLAGSVIELHLKSYLCTRAWSQKAT
jgi:hypothetical protein